MHQYIRFSIVSCTILLGLSCTWPVRAAFSDVVMGDGTISGSFGEQSVLTNPDASLWTPLFHDLDNDAYLRSLWQGRFDSLSSDFASAPLSELKTQSSLWDPIFAGLDSPTLFADVWQREFSGLEK